MPERDRAGQAPPLAKAPKQTFQVRLHRARRRFRTAYEELLAPDARNGQRRTPISRRDMNTPDSLRALHRANPRSTDGFTHTVEAAAHAVRARIAADGPPRAPSRRAPPVPSRRLAWLRALT